MKIPIVIDACTFINLLRIDEDDDFLYNHLKSYNVHITGTVYNEIKSNIFKNATSMTDRRRFNKIISSITTDFVFHNDESIKEGVGDYYEKVFDYVENAKPNGELYSSILALYLSRTEESKVCFLTDDFPAKENFKNFFILQQIGYIEDTVDLLLMLHWINSDFSKKRLENKLLELQSEYKRTQKAFVESVVELKTSFKKSNDIRKIIEGIEDAFYYSRDMDKYKHYLQEFEQYRNNVNIKACISEFPQLSKQPQIVEKAISVLAQLRKMDIYKR
jgi:hypothetical protein